MLQIGKRFILTKLQVLSTVWSNADTSADTMQASQLLSRAHWTNLDLCWRDPLQKHISKGYSGKIQILSPHVLKTRLSPLGFGTIFSSEPTVGHLSEIQKRNGNRTSQHGGGPKDGSCPFQFPSRKAGKKGSPSSKTHT